MRRGTRFVLAVTALVAVGLFGSTAPGVLAAPTPVGFGAPAPTAPSAQASAAAAPAAGKSVCKVTDQVRPNRLIELSGLVATDTGYVAVNDSTEVFARQGVFFLDKACKVSRPPVPLPSPLDPEDLAIGKDGTVWVADIGDNTKQRPHIGLWKVPPNGPATLFRMRYPDGKFDAEALLLDANDQPIIVTKGPQTSGVYTLNGTLNASQTVALQKVGQFNPQRTGTSTPLGFYGQTVVTGGANSRDRKKVVLRTLSDAYEWDVPDGDVVKAITTGKPRITPLPDEPQGEAITYSPDGATFLTVSETADQADPPPPPEILQYTPATEAKAPLPAAGAATKRNTLPWYQRLSLDQVTSLIAGVGVVGVLLVIVGVVGILRARRSRRSTARAARDGAATAGESGGQAYYGAGAGHEAEVEGSDERWRGGSGYTGTEYGGGQYGGGQYGDGYGDPQGYGPPAGYPPRGGR